MASRHLLIFGNIVAITVTIAAFAQALSWTIAGVLVLVSLFLPLIVNFVPRAKLAPHIGSKVPNASHHPNIEMKPEHKSAEKHTLSGRQSVAKTEPRNYPKQQAMKPVPQYGSEPFVPLTGASPVSPTGTTSLRLPPTKQGINFNPTIVRDDYMEYGIELDPGKDFFGEVEADGLVNVYLLDEENMDNLDEGEEFWSETGEECVETARLEFTAPSKGKWFFVVENADDRSITATVKLQKGPSTRTSA